MGRQKDLINHIILSSQAPAWTDRARATTTRRTTERPTGRTDGRTEDVPHRREVGRSDRRRRRRRDTTGRTDDGRRRRDGRLDGRTGRGRRRRRRDVHDEVRAGGILNQTELNAEMTSIDAPPTPNNVRKTLAGDLKTKQVGLY